MLEPYCHTQRWNGVDSEEDNDDDDDDDDDDDLMVSTMNGNDTADCDDHY